MRKRWLWSLGLSGIIALLLLPLMGFSYQKEREHHEKQHLKLVSGGLFPGGVPKDGIISGGLGCVPDIHQFDKGQEGGETIVFIAGISSPKSFDTSKVKVYVTVYSHEQKVATVQMMHSDGPEEPMFDYRNGNPLWIGPIHLTGTEDLPTGKYSYKFKAVDNRGEDVAEWEPKNNKFTVVDSSSN